MTQKTISFPLGGMKAPLTQLRLVSMYASFLAHTASEDAVS